MKDSLFILFMFVAIMVFIGTGRPMELINKKAKVERELGKRN